ncbi:Hemin transport system permease protein HmuU [Corynebacterium provencense]|uniref:Hemin transport system permease protein HmuU n=1 Tax=Corynebacterium provencense TaxID=1737425 RepID=A0A2Z3YMA1_9CORY|nr:iron ABC transporter permease [Corynebacterium provencense]AWT25162.1 Hemin transport system permease protein HmuU [Corynebacterium provencense]
MTVLADHHRTRPGDRTPDALGFTASHRRTVSWVLVLTVVLVVSLVFSVGFGSVHVPPSDSVRILAHHLFGAGPDPAGDGAGGQASDLARDDAVIWTIRAPRAVLGALVGAGLAVAGVILQAVVRNVLADPYVLGVSSGASVGAAGAITLGVGTGATAALGDYALQTSAFLGALVASVLVLGVARTAGRFTADRLLMAGIAVGYALSALTSFLVFASDSAESSRSVMFWLLGSLGLASWSGPLAAVAVVVVSGAVILTVAGPRVDALNLGDGTALTLGISPERLRLGLIVLSCLIVGAVVAMAGAIGFIGLVVPHLARRLVGGRHRALTPVAALLGAVLLSWADVGARTLLAPQEIPVGIITALVGAPFLLLLVHRMHRKEP